MKLSRRGEYAFLSMICLARSYSLGTYVQIGDIAKRYDIPTKFLEQILIELRKHDYLESKRGKLGGYKLKVEPRNITIAELFRAIDGPIAPVDSVSIFFYSKTPIEQEQKLRNLFFEVRNSISKLLESTTLEDLL